MVSAFVHSRIFPTVDRRAFIMSNRLSTSVFAIDHRKILAEENFFDKMLFSMSLDGRIGRFANSIAIGLRGTPGSTLVPSS